MVLVDTSVWIHHFKIGKPNIVPGREHTDILMHDFILGELSMGNFTSSKVRSEILDRLKLMTKIPSSSHEEVMTFIEKKKLMGKGIGYVDCHLIHSALKHKLELLTLDKKLSKVYQNLR